jgi:hypothetical protein
MSKLYTREELQKMGGQEFCDLYTGLWGWASTVLGELPSSDLANTTLDLVLVLQHKRLVAKTIGRNHLREQELMSIPFPFSTV